MRNIIYNWLSNKIICVIEFVLNKLMFWININIVKFLLQINIILYILHKLSNLKKFH